MGYLKGPVVEWQHAAFALRRREFDSRRVHYLLIINNKNMTQNSYHNLVQQLSEALDSYWRMDQYIKDAEEDNEPEISNLWKEYKPILKRQIELLKEAIKKKSAEE